MTSVDVCEAAPHVHSCMHSVCLRCDLQATNAQAAVLVQGEGALSKGGEQLCTWGGSFEEHRQGQ